MVLATSTIPVPDPTKLTTDAVEKLRKEITTIIDIRLEGMQNLYAEKFRGVATEFTMRDIALAAAFKAAEAAVKQQNESNTLAIDKASGATTKQIDGLDEKIDDLKERFSHLAIGNWAAIGGYLVGAAGVVALVVTILARIPH